MRRAPPASPPEHESQAGLRLAPMLDLAFVLLVLVLVAASLVRPTGVTVDQPAARSAEALPRAAIRVAVTADDEIWISERRVDARGVQLQLERLHAEYPRGGLVVHADRKSSARAVAAVLDAARAAGIEDVSLATQGG